ncbi:MAG: exosortase-associated EpsI family protein [Planctomycetota bacterium]|nr:exosortase-associated EpsI family protein [Planctomycetota bacterium]
MLVLVGVAGERTWLRAAAREADRYHQAVRRAADAVPIRIGMWFASDVEVPPAAVKMLHPNVTVSRRYTEAMTGRSVSVLIVQCTDARDLIGHYPPVCYPANGWKATSSSAADWRTDDLEIRGMQYGFRMAKVDRAAELVIDNFFILPDGRTGRDMKELDAVARNRRKRYFGAAQVQIVADAGIPAANREEFREQMLRRCRQFIDTVRRGVDHE